MAVQVTGVLCLPNSPINYHSLQYRPPNVRHPPAVLASASLQSSNSSTIQAKAYDDLYQRLDNKEGERDIFKIAKARERRTRDLDTIKCIKDDNKRILVKGEEIKGRWQAYFYNLFKDNTLQGGAERRSKGNATIAFVGRSPTMR